MFHGWTAFLIHHGQRALVLAFLLTSTSLIAVSPTSPPWSSTSQNGLFEVQLTPETGAVAIGPLQQWIVTVHTASGAPAYPARLLLDGGMRAHGHGLPTQPQITDYLGDGQYRIEGVRLNMPGAWTFMVGVDYAGQRDAATFELEIDY